MRMNAKRCSEQQGKKVLGRAFALVSTLALSCALLPAAAFASSGQLTTGPGPQSEDAQQVAALTTQAAVKSAKKTTKKSAKYTFKKYKKTKNYSNSMSAEYAYSRPVVKGSSKIVKRINKSLTKRYKGTASNRKTVFQSAESDSSYRSGGTYYFTTTAKATYNKKGYLSFKYSWKWFAGGVSNSADDGAVYSLKTGKKLNVSQVVSGSASQVKKKIANAVAAKYDGSLTSYVLSKSISDFSFYLKNGKVVVCFEPYEIRQGNFPFTITLKGNYE